MTAFHIKLIAIITMLIDHIGLFFFPDHVMFRLIGRLSFPLFAWLIANGAYHTHDMQKYFWRLVIFAALSQVPFMLANQLIGIPFMLNIFFTLSIGLGAIMIMEKSKKNSYKGIIVGLCAAAAAFLNADYGAFGVLLIVVSYIFFKHKPQLFIAQSILFLGYMFSGFLQHNVISIIEIFGLVSCSFIFLYNGREGPKMKYLFYLIYPLQYVVYYLLLIKK